MLVQIGFLNCDIPIYLNRFDCCSECCVCITRRVHGTFSDSVSSADGIHTQRPLEQRSNARGGRSTGRNDRPPRGRGHARDVPSNDRVKQSLQQPANASSPMSNDVTVQSVSTAKPAAINNSKEAGDGIKSASEKPPMLSQSKPVADASVNNTATAGTEMPASAAAVPPVGD